MQKASYPIEKLLKIGKYLTSILKKLNKNENLTKFDFLRKEVFSLIPNFTQLNELPVFSEVVINNTSSSFVSEEIRIRELDYFYTNSISEHLRQ